MPSQDDNLDELLKGLSLEEDETDLSGTQGTEPPDVDAVSGMTGEEIERLLGAGARADSASKGGVLPSGDSGAGQGDVLEMLDGEKDRDLREIKDMLSKSDKNETIGGGESPRDQGQSPADRLLADIEESGDGEVARDGMDGKSRKALEKERRREQKAAEKEAKKKAKQEAKAKKGGRRKGDSGKVRETVQNPEPPRQKAAPASGEFDAMLDRDLLDSIVSGADQVSRAQSGGKESKGVQTENEESGGEGGIGDLMDFAKAELYSSEDPEAEWEENQSAAGSGRDIMALDASEVDAMIPDRTERKKEKKEGLLSKMVTFLMEEDEEEDTGRGNEDVHLSEENEEILKDLDNEKSGKGKGKKGKKSSKKKKADKKKDKKAKPKKPPKPKKEKKPGEQEAYPFAKKLTVKKAMPVIIFGISLGLAIFIMVNLSADYADKQEALAAYRAGDYEACYRNLFGKKLNENEAIMYGRSESILYMRLWYREYEMLEEEGAQVEALDSLIQTVKDYPELYEYAAQWNAGMDVYEIYQDILEILSNKYGITEMQALEIAAVRSDLEYTRIVTALAKGESAAPPSVQEPKTLTLTEWYEGDDRRELEDQISQLLAGTNLTFYVEVQEPGTIVYNYKYTEQLDTEGLDEIQNYIGSSLDKEYMVYRESIGEFEDVYGIPVTAIRVTYINADGTELFSRDFTKDYVPGTNQDSGGSEELPDALPEESELEGGSFVEGQ